MAPGASRLRAVAAIAAASFAVHDLRYRLAAVDVAAGHGYLSWAGPLAGLLVAFAAARLICELAGGFGRARRPVSPLGLWVSCSGALLLVFATQELMEGALASSRAPGLAAVAAHGGWLAVPLSMALAAIVAVVLHSAEEVVRGPRRPVRVSWAFADATPPPRDPRPFVAGRWGCIALAHPGRAPPVQA